MKNDVQAKEEELKRLFSQKAEIQAKIDRLLMPQTIVAPPSNFDLYDEIEKVLKERSGSKISIDDIFAEVDKRWKDLEIPRKKVNSALVYLKRKNRVGNPEKGFYTVDA